MPRQRSMAFKARIPTPTALEFDRDDVEFAVPMRAARFGVDVFADDVDIADDRHSAGPYVRIRAVIYRSTDREPHETIHC